jgi:hypothetical protein
VPDRKLAAVYRRHAAEARRLADAATTPAERADILDVAKRWLQLARNHEAKIPTPAERKAKRKHG